MRSRKSTPKAGPAPAAPRRRPGSRRGDDLVAQPADVLLRLGQPVLVAADRLQVEIAPRRIDGVGTSQLGHGRDLGVGLEPARQPAGRRLDLGIARTAGATRVDDDLGGRERALADGARQHVESLHGLDVLWDALVRAGAELERDHRHRGEQQHGRRGGAEGQRPPHDAPGQCRPEAAGRVLAPRGEPARHEPQPVEPVAEPVDEHGKDGQRGQHRHGRDQQPRQPEASHERHGHEEHQRQPDRHRRAAEDDGPPGRVHRVDDGLLATVPGVPLLPVAVDDQQRVVDRDAEPDRATPSASGTWTAS